MQNIRQQSQLIQIAIDGDSNFHTSVPLNGGRGANRRGLLPESFNDKVGHRRRYSSTFVTATALLSKLAAVLDLNGGVVDEQSCRESTHSDPSGHKVNLVEQEDEVLVRFLFLDMFFDALAACAFRIPCVEYVNDHVGRVDDLVQFGPDPSRLTFGVSWL